MADQPYLSFCVVSDMHFMAWKDTNAPVEWVPQLKECLRDITSLNPAFLVSNGDQTNGKERDWRLAVSALKESCPFPVYYTMGNHEYYGYYEEPEFSADAAQKRFLEFTSHEAIYYERIVQGCRFIFLSTETYYPELNDAGWLSEKQLNWFEHRLSLGAPEHPAFVFLHQPVNDTVAESVHTCVQSERLIAILQKRPNVFLFTGHTHCPMNRPDQIVCKDGTVFVGGGSLCTPLPQSRWVELYEDRVQLSLRDHKNAAWSEEYRFTFYFR